MHGVDPDDGEDEYRRLRSCARDATGHEPLDRRIRSIYCRIAGRDHNLVIGGLAPDDEAQVVAILDLGRHLNYVVFTTADRDVPVLELGKHVYSVTDFE